MRLPSDHMHAALVKLQPYGAGNLGLAMIDRRLKHLALRREPEAVVDQFRITRHQFVLEVRRAAIQRQLLDPAMRRSEEHTSELQSLMRISYAVFCLKKKKKY